VDVALSAVGNAQRPTITATTFSLTKSGHAVVAHHLGMVVERVSILPADDGSGGRIWYDETAHPLDGQLMASMAGVEAEALFMGHRIAWHGEYDRLHQGDLLDEVWNRMHRLWQENEARRRMEILVRKNRPLIAAFAGKLLEVREMSGVDVTEYLRGRV
jgi:hypothetical protein